MTIYCDVDFHVRQQPVCSCDSAGEIRLHESDHERDDVRGFYSASAGEVVVGIEASGYSAKFVGYHEQLLWQMCQTSHLWVRKGAETELVLF